MPVTPQDFEQAGREIARKLGLKFEKDDYGDADEASFDLIRDGHDGAFDSYISVRADWMTDDLTVNYNGARGFGSGRSSHGATYNLPDNEAALKSVMERAIREMRREHRMDASDETALRRQALRLASETTSPRLRSDLVRLLASKG